MSYIWEFWIFSGKRGEYFDIDYNFYFIKGYIHIRYGEPLTE